MRELLDGELAPVTWEIGFVEADAAEAVERFAAWWKAPVWFLRRSVRVRRVEGDLRTLLCALDPLVDIETSRFLFVPTRSGWTAFFDNTEQGTESSGVMSVLAEDLRCRGVRARLTPEDGTDAGGAVIFELYGPEAKDILNDERSLWLGRESGRWSFDTYGTPLPFEEPDRYAARRVRDRFTPEMLERYLRELGGIRMQDEDFYAPDGYAFLVKSRPWLSARRNRKYPLAACAESRNRSA